MSLLLLFAGAGTTTKAPARGGTTGGGIGVSDVEHFTRKLAGERPRHNIHKDDNEVMEIIIEMIMSGILH